MKNLKTFICDPDKNTECQKTHCQTLCVWTTNYIYQKENVMNNVVNTINLLQELLEDTNAKLVLDSRGILFVRYFGEGHYKYVKNINEVLYMPSGSIVDLVKHHLYESQYEFDTRHRKKDEDAEEEKYDIHYDYDPS